MGVGCGGGSEPAFLASFFAAVFVEDFSAGRLGCKEDVARVGDEEGERFLPGMKRVDIFLVK